MMVVDNNLVVMESTSAKGGKRDKREKSENEKKRNPEAESAGDARPSKKAKHVHCKQQQEHRPEATTEHSVLRQYYNRIETLREYLIASLPPSSRLRRRKLASIGQSGCARPSHLLSDVEASVTHLLDSTLVAAPQEGSPARGDDRWDQWVNFSQKGDESYVSLSDGVSKALYCQSELVNFAIWSLFEQEKRRGGWPKNLICDGYRRNPSWRPHGDGGVPAADAIPSLFSVHQNHRAQTLRSSPWPELLSLLGQSGERMMFDLLMDCSIFTAVDAGNGNFYQLSGKPINDLEPLVSGPPKAIPREAPDAKISVKSPTEIVFVRNRMLYSRVSLNARGSVQFGLRHIHMLNRYPFQPQAIAATDAECSEQVEGNSKNRRNTLHCMMYLFPRQFGLHNVFTSVVDHTQTAQRFQDYTLREEEIQARCKGLDSGLPSLPKRLRGSAFELVQKLQILHGRCSYSALLHHYCPTVGPGETTCSQEKEQHGEMSSLVAMSTPVAQVSAYCQAVLSKIIPNDFWGTGRDQLHNKQTFLKHVDHFVRLRRFETMSLHELVQGLKVTKIEWLAPPGLKGQRASSTDLKKRMEIFHEFLYYLVDSLLIPLIRSNFYVTESNTHRSRLFYFRHDVWRNIAEPAMAALKCKMFEEVRFDDALQTLNSRALGYSQVRLLPKGSSVRPITNLRRRGVKQGTKKVLGPSINTILGPIHTVLKFEKNAHPSRLGATMFSVGDIYTRLKAFKARMATMAPGNSGFYFAKVDVQAAFDTIPQSSIIRLMANVPSHCQYRVVKHVEIQVDPNMTGIMSTAVFGKPTRRWRSSARDVGDRTTFMEMLDTGIAPNKTGTVFVDSVVQKKHNTVDLMDLMVSHIRQNLVKVGKKFYRQKEGIPQGSILSSILCNYFYADLEARHLGFLESEDSLLLRLIDDFLLITTDKAKACRFVEVMHAGVPDSGVVVNPGKSLVNFDMSCLGARVPRTQAHLPDFPYCGTLIHCNTLDISKDRQHSKDPVVSNSLTVDFSRHPGQNFQRKMLNAFKIQSHLMFFDTSHNSRKTAMRNLFSAMTETATKMWAYIRCLPKEKRPSIRLVTGTIDSMIDIAHALLSSKSRKLRFPGYSCGIKKDLVRWLALHAFKRVLTKKQARYGEVLSWLETEIQELKTKNAKLPMKDFVETG